MTLEGIKVKIAKIKAIKNIKKQQEKILVLYDKYNNQFSKNPQDLVLEEIVKYINTEKLNILAYESNKILFAKLQPAFAVIENKKDE